MNTNNGNRRTSLRLQSKLAKAKSISSSANGNLSTSVHTASTTTSTSHKLDNTKQTTENVLNSANKDNLRPAMILRSNLLGSSTQEIKTKLYRLGRISDKKFKLKQRKNLKNTSSTSANSNSNKKRNRNKLTTRKREKKLKTWSSTVSTSSSSSASLTQTSNVEETEIEDARPAASSSSAQIMSSASQTSSSSSSSSASLSSMPAVSVLDYLETNDLAQHSLPLEQNNSITSAISNSLSMNELKFQLKKATVKFNKACRQLTLLDQHMSDLQNSYSNAVDNDRKTFKIVFRMQLATLEGTHNAYIEYIERQVEKIKKLKQLLFTDNTSSNNSNTINNQNINNQPI